MDHQTYSWVLAAGIFIVALALAYSTADRVADKWRWPVAYLVFAACFGVLHTFASPIRERWLRQDCRALHSDADEIAGCIEDGFGGGDEDRPDVGLF